MPDRSKSAFGFSKENKSVQAPKVLGKVAQTGTDCLSFILTNKQKTKENSTTLSFNVLDFKYTSNTNQRLHPNNTGSSLQQVQSTWDKPQKYGGVCSIQEVLQGCYQYYQSCGQPIPEIQQ